MGAAGASGAAIVAAAGDASREIAATLGAEIIANAAGRGRQAALAARAVTVDGNEIRSQALVTVTPSRGRPRPAGVIFPGTEWGAKKYPQFPRHRKKGYWFNPTLDAAVPEMNDAWAQALDEDDAWSGTVKVRRRRGQLRGGK